MHSSEFQRKPVEMHLGCKNFGYSCQHLALTSLPFSDIPITIIFLEILLFWLKNVKERLNTMLSCI